MDNDHYGSNSEYRPNNPTIVTERNNHRSGHTGQDYRKCKIEPVF